MKTVMHSWLLAIVASAILLPVLASRHEPIEHRAVSAETSILGTSASASSPGSSTAAAITSTQAQTSAAAVTSSPTPASSAAPATSAAPSSSATNAAATTAATPSTHAVATSVVPTTATDSLGQVFTSYIENTIIPSSAAPSQTSTSNNSDGGLSTGSVVGLSVAGGLTAFGIALFLVWKCTRKRFADFDDSEAIKWPELNTHNTDVHALPTNSTGRAGFGPENDSDLELTRAPSPGGTYSNSIAASSVPEMYGSGDPYAVPPLPHMNPNQPYSDEPGPYGQSAGYYDPYRGPVPNTFADTISDGHDMESIPMTQMARVRSPAPQVAYDMQGRGSPAPQAAMGYADIDDRSRTPVPGALGAGRASPGPHTAYGYNPQ